MLYVDCHTWLSDNLLERGDRMAMAASVESRPPFLDHELVELAFSLPSRVKLRDRRGKWIAEGGRAAPPARRASSIGRRSASGCPLDAWFRGHLRELARTICCSARARSSAVSCGGR